jgi:GTPase SAR1 family protein
MTEKKRKLIILKTMFQVKCSVTGDAYVVVYSITDRQSFQTAVQLIKNIREKELANDETPLKRYTPIILVGNKSDLVRKRAVTKESRFKVIR